MNQMKECIDKGLIANKPQEELKDPKEDNDDNKIIKNNKSYSYIRDYYTKNLSKKYHVQ